ncbi:hypothetical protein [Neptuniibacter sp. CAU 1671]|uniref:hypothetical protein n=1 Tax=Neptuniibacter sp. CAU 1671 TaxID=3032593 RepID=UPI0023DADCAE|nr:hypothetical protein [Neptuniibacter sp. CAU 1671]MDF2183021.1 hypothetical protein [Neptuniibacter sp. CAU 1671]
MVGTVRQEDKSTGAEARRLSPGAWCTDKNTTDGQWYRAGALRIKASGTLCRVAVELNFIWFVRSLGAPDRRIPQAAVVFRRTQAREPRARSRPGKGRSGLIWNRRFRGR